MKLDIRGLGMGKTTDLLKLMATDDKIFYVAATERECNMAARKAARMGLKIARNRFTPAHLALRESRGRDLRYVVDNIEFVLNALLGGPVDVVTASTKRHPALDEELKAAQREGLARLIRDFWDEEVETPVPESERDELNLADRILTAMPIVEEVALDKVRADTWRMGAEWAGVELGVYKPGNVWLTEGDNPFEPMKPLED